MPCTEEMIEARRVPRRASIVPAENGSFQPVQAIVCFGKSANGRTGISQNVGHPLFVKMIWS